MGVIKNFHDRVEVEITDGVADVRMIRVDKRNALDNEMFMGLDEAGQYLKTAEGVRVAVLRGEGKSFCAGLDFSIFSQIAEGDKGAGPTVMGDRVSDQIANRAQRVAWTWQEVSAPVIASVHGHAMGGGFQIAMGADIRIAHPDTQFSVREMHWGLFPDMSGTLTLGAHVRPDVAKELIYSARIFDGNEAHALGIVTKVSADPLTDAQVLADQIASANPSAIRAAKRLVNRMAYGDAAGQLEAERTEIAQVIGKPNQIEAVMANLADRKPIFKDLD
jgi:enoyl-CoA hydratase/carnithine racemase